MRAFSLIIYFIVLIALVILGVIFAKDNSFLVSINFFGTELKAYPFWVTVFVSFIFGAVLMFLVLFWEFLKYFFSRHNKKPVDED